MADAHQMTAAAHLSHAERLLLEATADDPDAAHKLALVTGHLDCARTITVMEEAARNRQLRLDQKSQMAGLADLMDRVLPSREDGI